jgi:hypothetical protein
MMVGVAGLPLYMAITPAFDDGLGPPCSANADTSCTNRQKQTSTRAYLFSMEMTFLRSGNAAGVRAFLLNTQKRVTDRCI